MVEKSTRSSRTNPSRTNVRLEKGHLKFDGSVSVANQDVYVHIPLQELVETLRLLRRDYFHVKYITELSDLSFEVFQYHDWVSTMEWPNLPENILVCK
jgi:hypothetical protein